MSVYPEIEFQLVDFPRPGTEEEKELKKDFQVPGKEWTRETIERRSVRIGQEHTLGIQTVHSPARLRVWCPRIPCESSRKPIANAKAPATIAESILARVAFCEEDMMNEGNGEAM